MTVLILTRGDGAADANLADPRLACGLRTLEAIPCFGFRFLERPDRLRKGVGEGGVTAAV